MDNIDPGVLAMASGAVEPPKMPSADLINYRFDQADKQFAEISSKLDHLSNNFVTKEELQTLTSEFEAYKNDRRWWSRMVIGASVSALMVSIGTLIVYVILRMKP